MSDLHPTARALIEAAKRREAPLADDTRTRVHRSVLRRAAALSAAAMTTTTATGAAKAGPIATVLAHPLLSSGIVTALAGFTVVAVHTVSTPLAPTLSEPLHAASSVPAIHIPRAPAVVEARADREAKSVRPDVTREVSIPAPPPKARVPEEHVLRPAEDAPQASSRGHSEQQATSEEPAKVGSPVAKSDSSPTGAGTQSVDASDQASPLSAPRPAAIPPIALELAVLHRVHEALQARKSARALALLDSNAAALNRGPLAEEAQAARVSAMCQMGRESEARAAMDQFDAAWPRSPLAVRLRADCRISERATSTQTE